MTFWENVDSLGFYKNLTDTVDTQEEKKNRSSPCLWGTDHNNVTAGYLNFSLFLSASFWEHNGRWMWMLNGARLPLIHHVFPSFFSFQQKCASQEKVSVLQWKVLRSGTAVVKKSKHVHLSKQRVRNNILNRYGLDEMEQYGLGSIISFPMLCFYIISILILKWGEPDIFFKISTKPINNLFMLIKDIFLSSLHGFLSVILYLLICCYLFR